MKFGKKLLTITDYATSRVSVLYPKVLMVIQCLLAFAILIFIILIIIMDMV